MADLIIVVIIGTIMSFTFYRYIKSKKSGQSGCAGCSFSTTCGDTPTSCHQSTSTLSENTAQNTSNKSKISK